MAEMRASAATLSELARIARFGAVGLLSSALYMGIFALLIRLIAPVPASVLAYALSAGLNYVLQSSFTFRKSPVNAGNAGRFLAMHLFCAGTNTGLLWLLTQRAHLPALPTQAVLVLLVAALSYLISKHWVYRGDPAGEGAAP